MGADARFVRDHTRVTAVHFVPEVRLNLAVGEAVDLWETTQEAGGSLGGAPPFWAFAWAGGLALARHLLDHPGLVTDRDVVDVATGSGLVAIAASLAGARSVRAHDVDATAVVATRLNATANAVRLNVTVADIADLVVAPGELVLAGDVFYDRDMSREFLRSLRRARAAGADVLIGDPYRHYLPTDDLLPVAEYEVDVDVELESAPVKAALVAWLR